MGSPYDGLPREAFWKTGVAEQGLDAISGLYRKRFVISPKTVVATAGSCFAQHISKHLQARGFCVLDAEPAPWGLDAETAQRFGYGLYSARYGNIYTARQLRQLAEEAFGKFQPAEPVWRKGDRFYDAFRPSVEPGGLSSAEAVLTHRAYHLKRVQHVITTAEVFVFTLGLTEAWIHKATGTVYPTAPGVIAGQFDDSIYQFRNYTFHEIYTDLLAFIRLAKSVNQRMRFVFTVSPVPLTATASGEHVLCATTYSKSVLRAAAGQLFQTRKDVDYVPSYEVITGALSGGRYFDNNLRTIRREGVDAVMQMFFSEHDAQGNKPSAPARRPKADRAPEFDDEENEVVCEEALLEAFAR
jgi:hypothetical protein